MVATRSLLVAAAVAGAALLATAATVANTSDRPRNENVAAPPRVSATPSLLPRPTPTAAAPSQPAGSPTTVRHPPERGPFSLVVTTRAQTMRTGVNPIDAASGQPVDPPHATAAQWATAAWVRQSCYPAEPSTGTSYVYGHACHYHLCPFSDLKDAAVGDSVTITTVSATLTYRIARIGLSPKSARSLPSWASDSTVPDRVVLVTCAFEQGDTSTHNIVVAATLKAAHAE